MFYNMNANVCRLRKFSFFCTIKFKYLYLLFYYSKSYITNK